MKKLAFAVLTALLISTCSQGQTQNDFYGDWVYTEVGTLGGENKMECTITASTFTTTFTFELNTSFSPPRRTVYEIFSWEKISNEDAETQGDYPAGFLLGLRAGLGNTTAKLFMHRNKNSFISAYEYNGVNRKEVYIKQGNITSAAPLKQQELFNFISELTDNFPANEKQAVERFIARGFLPDNKDGTYICIYDKVKAGVYFDEYPNVLNTDIIHFVLEFDNEAAHKTTLENLTSYLSKKYDEQSYYSEISKSNSYTYYGSAVIHIMDGKGIYDGFTLAISIG